MKTKNKQKKVNKIPDGWEVKKLGNIGKTFQGLTGKTKEDFTDKKEVGNPFISYMNIFSNTKIDTKNINTFVKIEDGENQKTAKYGDSFFTTSSETPHEVGMSATLLNKDIKELYLNSFSFGFRMENFDFIIPEFSEFYFSGQIFRKKMARLAQGASRYNLSKKYFLDTKIEVPKSLEEQKRIVGVLGVWDEVLEKLKRKIEMKKNIKKGLMQNLLTGKIRVGNFSEKWEEKKLGDIVNFWNGKGHEKNITKSGFVVVNSKFVSSDGKVRKFSDKQISPLKNNDVVMVMSDVPNGKAIAKTFLIDKDNFYTLNQRIGGFRSEKIISYILSKLLNRSRYFLSFDDGAKQTNLRKDDILDFKIKFPKSLEEQKAIADILMAADEELEELLRKQKLYEEQKRFLLNNLISGEIRVAETMGV